MHVTPFARRKETVKTSFVFEPRWIRMCFRLIKFEALSVGLAARSPCASVRLRDCAAACPNRADKYVFAVAIDDAHYNKRISVNRIQTIPSTSPPSPKINSAGPDHLGKLGVTARRSSSVGLLAQRIRNVSVVTCTAGRPANRIVTYLSTFAGEPNAPTKHLRPIRRPECTECHTVCDTYRKSAKCNCEREKNAGTHFVSNFVALNMSLLRNSVYYRLHSVENKYSNRFLATLKLNSETEMIVVFTSHSFRESVSK